MKKYVFFVLASLTLAFILVRCAKDNSDKPETPDSPEVANRSNQKLESHMVSPEDAKAMMKRYDDLIGSVIAEKYKGQNSKYISPTMTVYEIEPLIQFLNQLKEKGNNKVIVRYAAIDGDGVNQRIPGLPYHSLLFYGKNNNTQSKSGEVADGGYFDHGTLIPPCTWCPNNDCDKCPDEEN